MRAELRGRSGGIHLLDSRLECARGDLDIVDGHDAVARPQQLGESHTCVHVGRRRAAAPRDREIRQPFAVTFDNGDAMRFTDPTSIPFARAPSQKRKRAIA